MSADVIVFGGQKIAAPGKPDADVVAELEGLLEAARSGRIAGIAYAIDYSDGSVCNRHVGTISRAHVGALFAVMGRISREIDAP